MTQGATAGPDAATAPEAATTVERGGPDGYTVRAEGITKSFGAVRAVDNVSFGVRKGEVVGLLGPNGAGKTTTMRLLTRYYTPDRGSVYVRGVDLQNNAEDARQWIGYLPEGNPLYDDLLVSEYLEMVADLRRMAGGTRRPAIERTVADAGLEEVFYRPIGELSKGNRQRVGLAQAILHEPEVLILDEPTEGLDPNQRAVIRDLIRSLGEERTVLLSTHVLSEVEGTCDRVLIISRGRLAADGTMAELMGQAGQRRIVRLEAQGDGIAAALAKLPGIEDVEQQEAPAGRERYGVTAATGEDPRPEIFRLARDRDWTLWELHLETGGLETLFRQLTGEAAVVEAGTTAAVNDGDAEDDETGHADSDVAQEDAPR